MCARKVPIRKLKPKPKERAKPKPPTERATGLNPQEWGAGLKPLTESEKDEIAVNVMGLLERIHVANLRLEIEEKKAECRAKDLERWVPSMGPKPDGTEW